MSAQAANSYRPCLLLAAPDRAAAGAASLCLRRAGWDVYQAQNAGQLRRLARLLTPDLIVLDIDTEGESGWLTCVKLKHDRPESDVILLSGDDGPRSRVLAQFVGAGLLALRQSHLPPLLHSRWLAASTRTSAEAA